MARILCDLVEALSSLKTLAMKKWIFSIAFIFLLGSVATAQEKSTKNPPKKEEKKPVKKPADAKPDTSSKKSKRPDPIIKIPLPPPAPIDSLPPTKKKKAGGGE